MVTEIKGIGNCNENLPFKKKRIYNHLSQNTNLTICIRIEKKHILLHKGKLSLQKSLDICIIKG